MMKQIPEILLWCFAILLLIFALGGVSIPLPGGGQMTIMR
jgi:hypothetical protein